MTIDIIGINIQFPISQLILSGEKKIETRTYNLPEKYINQTLLFIETPGKLGNFKARGVALISFTKTFKYNNQEDFYKDEKLHLVSKDSPWRWIDKPKWGWECKIIKTLKKHIPIYQKKGIIFTHLKNISVDP